jgi:hypothetical protein
MSATGTSGITSISVTGSHGMQTATTTIEATTSSLDVGDAVSVSIGYEEGNDYGTVFNGYVSSVSKSESNLKYTINALDTLKRAMDYFIVSSNPETPFSRSNISAETLVGELLAMAGLTNYHGDTTNFVLATLNPVEVNLTSAYDYCKFLADLLAWHLHAEVNGQVHFTDRKPYVDGDSSYKTIHLNQILNLDYVEDANNLRNRVVLYGANGLTAEASAHSDYLPDGFYKSAVVSAPMIDNQSYADQCVAYNLALYNRLTKMVSLSVIGDHELEPRKALTLHVEVPKLNQLWYVYGVSHTASSSGYITELELRD